MNGKKGSFPFSGPFKKLLMSYIIVIVLLATVFTSFLTVRAYRTVSEDALNSQLNRLNRIAQRHGEYLTNMQNTADQMSISPFIKSFVYREHPDMAYQLMKHLSLYAATNTFCERMFLCFSIDDHIYSSQNSMTMETLTGMVHFEHLSDEQLVRLLHDPGQLTVLPAQKVQSSLLDGGSEPIVTYVLPFGLLKEDRGTLMFLVRKPLFDSLFADAVASENNTYILYRGQMLVSSNSFEIPDEQVLSALESGRTKFSFDGETWQLVRVEGALDMEYVSLFRKKDMNPTLMASLGSGLSILGIETLLAFFIAYRLARHNWQPVQEITRLLPSDAEQEDDWQVIKQGISALSERNAALSTQLEHALPMQRHDFVISFLKNHYPTRQEAVAAASRVGLDIDKPYYAVALCFDPVQGKQAMDLSSVSFRTLRDTEVCQAELVAMDANLYLIFAGEREDIVRAVSLIHDRTQEQTGQAVTTVSAVHEDMHEVSTAYLEAAAAYDNRFVMTGDKPLYYENIPMDMGDILPQAAVITDSINQALLLRSEDLLNSKIDELLQFLKRTSMSSFSFRLIYNNVIETLLKEHMDELSREREAQEIYDILMLTGCTSMEDVSELLRRLCNFIMTSGEAEPSSSDEVGTGDIMDRVVAYIDAHDSDKELSISAISETFGMPNARLSQLFKGKMKVTPLDYLTMLRVEHSKTLLMNTDMSVKDIAEAVGYYDAGSFIRRFRQKVGVTPLQYKRSKEGNEGDLPDEG